MDWSWLAEQIVSTCGAVGKLLHIDCTGAPLVETLLRKGCDAWGCDASERAVHELNRRAPGRFFVSRLPELAPATPVFNTVVCTGLADLSPADVPSALKSIYKSTGRNLVVVLAGGEREDRRGAGDSRSSWEHRCFEAGFRRHPLLQSVTPYNSIELSSDHPTLLFEKVPDAAMQAFPPSLLLKNRMLHMDMLREAGRRSDAHIARYMLACPLVRPGDVVLDVACGLGYGSAILAAGSPCGRVIGVDNSDYAIDYALANYAASYPLIEFHKSDAAGLEFLADNSVDMAVSMETLEHVPDPAGFLKEVKRVLRPSGRLIVSVPNDWTDETGRDPNPHHLHVYTWDKLRAELGREFLLEQRFAQVAGGGMKLSDQPRQLVQVSLDNKTEQPAEWWIAVAMKDAVGAPRESFAETTYPACRTYPGYNVTEFARDYDNPWLVKAMVAIGARSTSPAVLEDMATRVLASSRPGSSDRGAALCVLGYRLLETSATAENIAELLQQLDEYDRRADASPHAQRWRISNRYLAALLRLKTGRRDEALRSFEDCAALDFAVFSPLLATKTVDALFQAGLLAAGDQNYVAARSYWERAIREAQRALSGDWTNIVRSVDEPISFGLAEVAELAELGNRCVYGVLSLEHWSNRPGLSWKYANSRVGKDLRDWVARLAASREYLERDAQELRRWVQQVEQGKTWLEEQYRSWQAAALRVEQVVAEQRAWIEQLETGKRWLEQQMTNWRQSAEANQRTIEELRNYIEQLEATPEPGQETRPA